MMQQPQRVASVVGGALAATGASAFFAGRSFQRRVTREIDDLLIEGNRAWPGTPNRSEFESLPQPVRLWMDWAQVGSKPYPATVRLHQAGEFRLRDAWRPFHAEQYFSIHPPGFVWRATMQLAPLVQVLGRDRWIDGDASIQMRIGGLIPVANSHGEELAQSAMLRWLGEIIWFPQAAIGPDIRWEPLTRDSARASIAAGGQTGFATFTFDVDGRPSEFRADRFNDAKKSKSYPSSM